MYRVSAAGGKKQGGDSGKGELGRGCKAVGFRCPSTTCTTVNTSSYTLHLASHSNHIQPEITQNSRTKRGGGTPEGPSRRGRLVFKTVFESRGLICFSPPNAGLVSGLLEPALWHLVDQARELIAQICGLLQCKQSPCLSRHASCWIPSSLQTNGGGGETHAPP